MLTFKISILKKYLLFCIGLLCIGLALFPGIFTAGGERLFLATGSFSPLFWNLAGRNFFVLLGLVIALAALSMAAVVITPQYIQFPFIKMPVLWRNIKHIELQKIRYMTTMSFYLQKERSVRFYMFRLFPRKTDSFSFSVSFLSQPKAFVETVQKYVEQAGK